MENNRPDALLAEIEEKLRTKPEKPDTQWYAEMARLLCYAPLRLLKENPTPGEDGHPYLLFRLPHKDERADIDFSQYTLQEHCHTIIELACGAVIQYPQGGTLWSFTLGSLLNLSTEKDPYKTKDGRNWNWPKETPSSKEILLHRKEDSGLPEEVIIAIDSFLKSIKPHIQSWGIASYHGKTAMFILPAVPTANADPAPILDFLHWFTPNHHKWIALDA